MLEVAVRRIDGSAARFPARAESAVLPVHLALRGLLPDGMQRGGTVALSGSMSLLLALLGEASAEGGWCALVGLPPVSAEAAAEYGIDPSRLVLVPGSGNGWTTAVGALLDAFDVVAARPPRQLPAGDVRRLAARVRVRKAVLVPYVTAAADWPGADLRLTTRDGRWSGLAGGYGRLRQRQVTVTAERRNQPGRVRSARLWLPAAGGGVAACEQDAAPAERPARVG